MKEQHNIDGIYFRVLRDGIYQSICFSDLTEAEMLEVLKNKDIEWIRQLAIILGNKLYEIAEQFDIYKREDD